jgi:hypothetical protein
MNGGENSGSVVLHAKKIRAGTYLLRDTPGPDYASVIIVSVVVIILPCPFHFYFLTVMLFRIS